jgi:hypothetical protein
MDEAGIDKKPASSFFTAAPKPCPARSERIV